MRLTKKKEEYIEGLKTNGHIYFVDDILPSNCDLTSRSINKLGRLEDIEEVCEKLVSQPIYEKYADTHEIHKEDYTECRALYSFEFNRIELYLWDFLMAFELDQYGKTWAFTKEELL